MPGCCALPLRQKENKEGVFARSPMSHTRCLLACCLCPLDRHFRHLHTPAARQHYLTRSALPTVCGEQRDTRIFSPSHSGRASVPFFLASIATRASSSLAPAAFDEPRASMACSPPSTQEFSAVGASGHLIPISRHHVPPPAGLDCDYDSRARQLQNAIALISILVTMPYNQQCLHLGITANPA